VLKVGDELDVYVLDVDQKRKRIALSLKKLQPDPWTIVDDHYQMGQLVEGRVTRVLDFGAFVELDIGVEGLLHASEIIGTPELAPSDIVHPGEKLLVKIIRIDSRRKRLALSARQVRKDEWERWVAEQQEESAVDETVEEETAAPEAEITVSEAVEEETVTAAAETETETGEVVEEETAAPEAEITVSEEAEEETVTAAETETGEVAEAEAAAPETETVASEEAEEETVTAAEAETETGEVAEAETAAPEAETMTSEEAEEETTEPKAEAEISETAEASDEPVAIMVEPAPDVTSEETEATL
jgi:small subunit ribosomal protein S1